MVYLTKERSLFSRDENGNLLPVEVTLELLKDKPTIKVIPMTVGEIKRLYTESKNAETTKSQDNEIILKHCIEPRYTEDEIKFLKPAVAGAIVTAIISISTDVSQEDISKSNIKKATQDFLLSK